MLLHCTGETSALIWQFPEVIELVKERKEKKMGTLGLTQP